MSSKELDSAHFSADTLEFLYLLDKHQVAYVIVGGEAVIYYGHVRLTGDVDFFYANTPENIQKLYRVLDEFWGGSIPDISGPDELGQEGLILHYGIPPNRIDLINMIDNVAFDKAWQTRETAQIRCKQKKMPVYFISIDLLIENKKHIKRHKDLEDLEFLKERLKVKDERNKN